MAEMRRSPRSAKPEKNRGQQKHDPTDIEAAKRRRFAAAQAKYKKTVAEARKRLEEAKKKLWPSAKPKKKGASNKAAKKRDSKDKGAKKRVRKQGQKKTNSEKGRVDYERLVKRIKAAVDSGRITETEAKKKLQEIRKKMTKRQ